MKTNTFNDDIWRGLSQVFVIGLVWSLSIFWLGFNMDIFWALIVGYGTWGIFLCLFPSVFDEMFFTLKPNYGLTLVDYSKNDSPSALEDRTTSAHITSMRECGPGLHGKWLWESIISIYDMRRRLPLGNTLRVPDKNGTYFNITWQAFAGPFYGGLINLTRTSEKTAQAKSQNFCIQTLTDEIGRSDGAKIQKNLKKSQEWFENMLGKNNQRALHKTRYGLDITIPQILNMITDDEVQVSSQEEIEAKNDVKAAKVYVKASNKKLDMVAGLNLVFARAGKAKMFQGVKTVIAEEK